MPNSSNCRAEKKTVLLYTKRQLVDWAKSTTVVDDKCCRTDAVFFRTTGKKLANDISPFSHNSFKKHFL